MKRLAVIPPLTPREKDWEKDACSVCAYPFSLDKSEKRPKSKRLWQRRLMGFTSDNACVGIVYEEEARIGVHVRPFASLEVEVQLKAIRRNRAHATVKLRPYIE